MKTAKAINLEIKELNESLAVEPNARRKKSIRKKIELLRMCRLYLETSPRPEFIQATAKDIRRKIAVLDRRYAVWLEVNASKFKNPRYAYNSESGINSLKASLKTVLYLIDD